MRVSDHALVRYIDRRLRIGVEKLSETHGVADDRAVLTYFIRNCRIDIDAWRRELRDHALKAAKVEPGDRGHHWFDGLGYVIKDNVLVTVIPEGKPARRKRLRRLPKLRRPGAIRTLLAKHGRVTRRMARESAE